MYIYIYKCWCVGDSCVGHVHCDRCVCFAKRTHFIKIKLTWVRKRPWSRLTWRQTSSKMFQIVPCAMSHLSWQFHENPFISYSLMLLTHSVSPSKCKKKCKKNNVVAFANICSDIIAMNGITVKGNSHRHELWCKCGQWNGWRSVVITHKLILPTTFPATSVARDQ